MTVGKEFDLRVDEYNLLGYERVKSGLAVNSLMIAVAQGAKLPPVNVFKINHETYMLHPYMPGSSGYNDGGHHRALTYMLLGVPLRCKLQSGPASIKTLCFLPEITLDFSEKRFEQRIKREPVYAEYDPRRYSISCLW